MGSAVTVPKKRVNTVLVRKGGIKSTIIHHLHGLGGVKSGLIFKALERLNDILTTSQDKDAILTAVDKVIKLLPYAIKKEDAEALIVPGSGGTINIAINNFDSFIKNRLQGTHLGELFEVPGAEVIESVEMGKKEPAAEGATPGGHPSPTTG